MKKNKKAQAKKTAFFNELNEYVQTLDDSEDLIFGLPYYDDVLIVIANRQKVETLPSDWLDRFIQELSSSSDPIFCEDGIVGSLFAGPEVFSEKWFTASLSFLRTQRVLCKIANGLGGSELCTEDQI